MAPQSSTYEALCEALDDEYKARATYRAVIAKFGPVLPFANIVNSEQCHINALLPLFAARGWTPPADRWDGNVTAPDTITESCAVGVQAEIENAALYDRLFSMTTDQEILSVFGALRWASAERHLPAFQRCSDGDMSGCSPGGGRYAHGGGGGCCGGRGGHGGHGGRGRGAA